MFDFRSSPTVDRLVIITDDTDAAVVFDEGLDDQELNAVGVLILVDLHVVKAVLMLFEDLGVFGKKGVRLEEEIVEVEGGGRFEGVLVAAIGDGGEDVAVVVAMFGGVLGTDAVHFPAADAGEQVAGLDGDIAETDFAQRGAGGGFLIGAIENREGFGVAEYLGFLSEDVDAQRVERADMRPFFHFASQQMAGALEHFSGRFIREGDGQNPIGRGSPANNLGHTVGDDTRFASSRARED